jgi:signal transduction histidine kinase
MPILSSCLLIVEAKAREKDIAVECNVEPDFPLLLGDALRLKQILINLLGNAVKFTKPGGSIVVACDLEGDRVRLSVRDTGVGISPQQLERIFDPFVQIDARYTRSQQGVGLGLAISRDLALGMGGDLTVESSPGAGSTFTLTLPAAVESNERPGGPHPGEDDILLHREA